MSNWFIFYVQTGKEQTACDFLNRLFDRKESLAFIPQVETIFKNSKILRKELKPMFPGYVFTDSILEEKNFIIRTSKYIKFSKCIFNLLGNNAFSNIKLSEDEKNFLLKFCNDEYIAEESKGLIIGDKVYVTSGPLIGKESIIRKINRHKRRAEIELMCCGEAKRISVPFEVVSKVI